MTQGRSIIYNPARTKINWITPKKRSLFKRNFPKRDSGPIHVTIYAVRDELFHKYAVEWVRLLKTRYPNEPILAPVAISSLKTFLDFLTIHAGNDYLTFTFFGHGYPGGIIFDGTMSHHIDAFDSLDLDVNKDSRYDWGQLSSTESASRKLLIARPMNTFFHCFSQCSAIRLFACHTSEAERTSNAEDFRLPISVALSSYCSTTVITVNGTVHYLREDFGFSKQPTVFRTDSSFQVFEFDVCKSGNREGSITVDFFREYP